MKKLPGAFTPRWGPWYMRYKARNAAAPLGARIELGFGMGANFSVAVRGEGLHFGFMPRNRLLDTKKRARRENQRGVVLEVLGATSARGILYRTVTTDDADRPRMTDAERKARHEDILRRIGRA